MSIKSWPEADMPKEKLLKHGANQLTDAELLAILINTGIRGKSALDISRGLLGEFTSLKQLFDCHYTELANYPGIGKSKYVLLQTTAELGKRYLNTTVQQGQLLSSVTDTKQFLAAQLKNNKTESFSAIFLNNQHKVICYEVLFKGTVNHAVIYPREVVQKVLQYHAKAVIFAHNHPSGDAEPSAADKAITSQLKIALDSIDVSVLDHFIVGSEVVFSFKEHGLM